ncbi:hypothetical protein IFM89_003559 [Coptis chinensis]|uniref:Kinesin motor domain-containing protein n=1 Tax=Coptis chinensis TaxID=261450 RepID=A0A835GWN6_9MAGN|nr:hypothetical protein IFM89_003559 [Coptis chinensis]
MESSGQSSGSSALHPLPSGQATPPAGQETPPVTSESSGAPSSELKGNIRVFYRVRPMLPDDGASVEASVICYLTSMESLGRGIDLLQNGILGIDKSGLTAVQLHWQKHQFTFDKVFTHESS